MKSIGPAGGNPVHASAVSIDGRGGLVRGPSGSGKSSLVLALLDRDPEATRLVSDDRTDLAAIDGHLIASPPTTIAGKLEVRGQGIFDLPHVSRCIVALVVDLLPAEQCPRLPADDERKTEILGLVLPWLMLPRGAPDGAVRVRFALRSLPS